MATVTPNLGLIKPSRTDKVRVEDLNSNFDKIDDAISNFSPGTGGGTGENGATFIPSVDADGNLSWTNDGGLENPQTVNIKGPKGETGADGADGKDGADGATAAEVAAVLPQTTALNFTNWDSGSFTETLSTGTTITHTVTFDANGIPTAIGGITISGVS